MLLLMSLYYVIVVTSLLTTEINSSKIIFLFIKGLHLHTFSYIFMCDSHLAQLYAFFAISKGNKFVLYLIIIAYTYVILQLIYICVCANTKHKYISMSTTKRTKEVQEHGVSEHQQADKYNVYIKHARITIHNQYMHT